MDGEPKAKKMKTGKDDKKSQKSKDSSPKKSDPSKSDTPKINLIRPGGQARDKFGFFVAAQPAVLPDKEKESPPSKKRSSSRGSKRRSGSRGSKRKEERSKRRSGSG